MFRIIILGAQVPDVIAERIFVIFASVLSVQGIKVGNAYKTDLVNMLGNASQVDQPDKMDFTDLCQCYFVFKYQRPYEMAQLCFEMLKLTKDQDYLSQDDLETWCVRILQLDVACVNLFYYRSEFDPRINITKDEFIESFVSKPNIANIQFLKAIPEIINEFKTEFLNYEHSMYSNKSMGLSEI